MERQETSASRPEGPQEAENWEAQRRHRRKPVLWRAALETPAGRHDCIILDLSLGGAKLRVAAPVDPARPVILVIERFGPLRAEVAWVGDGTVGIRFTDDPAQVASAVGGRLPL